MTDADGVEAEQVVGVTVQVVVTSFGVDGPVVAWTSRLVLAGESLPAASPGSGLRITELRLTLFDR